MLRVVVLLETIPIRKGSFSIGHEHILQNFFYVELFLHYAGEDQNRRRSSHRNPSPDVNFKGMFASRFRLSHGTLLSKADLPVFFEPDGALVSEDNVSKGSRVLLGASE